VELSFNSQPESNISFGSHHHHHRLKTGPVKRSVTLNDQVLLRHRPILRDIMGEVTTHQHQ
jgi:hypothetical protein